MPAASPASARAFAVALLVLAAALGAAPPASAAPGPVQGLLGPAAA